MFKKVFIGVFILAVVAVFIFLVFKGNGKSDAAYTLVNVERGTIIDKAMAIGRIEPENEIAVKSKIPGIVKKIYVEIGENVPAGAPLVEIRPDPTPLEYAEAKRNVEIEEVSLETAKRNLDRSQNLREKSHISQKELDDAQSAYDEADLRLKLAREKLALIESGKTTIADRTVESVIKAPVGGMVLSREVDEGDPVVPLTTFQSGTELFYMAPMTELVFRGTVDEIDVGKLAEGMEADIKIGALPNAKAKGTLYKISPKARKEDNTILFDVEIALTETGEQMLRAGYSATAEIVITRKDSVLMLPERLVQFRNDSSFVELLDGLGEPAETLITTGLSDGLNIEIASGLAESTQVVQRPPKEIK
jgi:HlyD family secretion protein